MNKDNGADEFDWVTISTNMEKALNPETTPEKFMRKLKENPFIPVGCLLTTAALAVGLYSFKKGDSKTSQLMMRFRIGAQGFTVLALVAGIGSTVLKQ